MKFLHHFAFLAALTFTSAAQSFTFTNITDKSIALFDGSRPVFVYNHGIMQKAGVPADRARSSYIHPLYGLDGEALTDDFPKDHYHHRGVFWAWPHVRIGDRHYDLWMLKGIEHRFQKWIAREATSKAATLQLENGWFVGARNVMREEVSICVFPASENSRAIDIELSWTPIDHPIALEGAEDKSYGGLTIRFAPRTNTAVTTPLGHGEKDLTMTRLPWADLSGRFENSQNASGAAIFVAPDHPDFPPEWLTRHYGALCLGWPGVKPKTLQVGETIRCHYRLWIHRGARSTVELTEAYHLYKSRF
jgi:hypothetical protein